MDTGAGFSSAYDYSSVRDSGAYDDTNEEPHPSQVVNLVTRKEGEYTVHTTPSVYSGGSLAGSPDNSPDDQVRDLQEALNDKELELMELREQHMRLQARQTEARANWEAALQSKDRAIQQLEQALESRERALNAMAQREQAWNQANTVTEAERKEHNEKMQALQAQVTQANSVMATLKQQIQADHARAKQFETQLQSTPRSPAPGVPNALPGYQQSATPNHAVAEHQAQLPNGSITAGPHATPQLALQGPSNAAWQGTHQAAHAGVQFGSANQPQPQPLSATPPTHAPHRASVSSTPAETQRRLPAVAPTHDSSYFPQLSPDGQAPAKYTTGATGQAPYQSSAPSHVQWQSWPEAHATAPSGQPPSNAQRAAPLSYYSPHRDPRIAQRSALERTSASAPDARRGHNQHSGPPLLPHARADFHQQYSPAPSSVLPAWHLQQPHAADPGLSSAQRPMYTSLPAAPSRPEAQPGAPRAASPASSPVTQGRSPVRGHEELMRNLAQTHALLAHVRERQEGRRAEAQQHESAPARQLSGEWLQGLLRKQEQLLQDLARDSEHGAGVAGHREEADGAASGDVAHLELEVLTIMERNVQEAVARAQSLEDQNAQLDGENSDLQAALRERDGLIAQMQARLDHLRQRLLNLEGQLPAEKWAAHEKEESAAAALAANEQMAEDVQKLQRRLLARDAAAKKYKEGCRALKLQLEKMEETCAEVRLHNTELKDELATARSAARSAHDSSVEQQQAELRNLVASAQQDVDTARLASLKAERERRAAVEQVAQLEAEVGELQTSMASAAKRQESLLEAERQKLQRAMQQHEAEMDAVQTRHTSELETIRNRCTKADQRASSAEEALLQKEAQAEDRLRGAEARAAEAQAELVKARQRVLDAEGADKLERRKLEAVQSDLMQERQHTAMLEGKLERAQSRAQKLEHQVALAEEKANGARQSVRDAESSIADLEFKLSQAERRNGDTHELLRDTQGRLEAAQQAARSADERAAAAARAVSEHEARVREWEEQLRDADRALTVSEAKVGEVTQQWQEAQCRGEELRAALLRTEEVLLRLRGERAQESDAAVAEARQEAQSLRAGLQDMRVTAERNRIAKDRAEVRLKEVQQAYEAQQASVQRNRAEHRAQSSQAAQAVEKVNEQLRSLQDALALRDATIRELESQLTRTQRGFTNDRNQVQELQQQVHSQQEQLRLQREQLTTLADKDKQLQAAQARLQQVAPLIRRIASRVNQ